MNIRISLIGFLMLCVLPSLSLAKDKPYKATTVDECINEKECVWYAFEKHITLSDFETVEYSSLKDEKVSISKWEEPVTVYFNDQSNKQHLLQVAKALKQIEPYFGQPISIDKNYNMLIMFSDDFEKDITVKYRRFFNVMFDGDKVFNWYQTYGRRKEVCFDLSIDNTESFNVTGNIIFINKKSRLFDYCAFSTIYSALGLSSAIDDFGFSFFSSKGKGTENELTKLDLFLIYLLYQPEFQSGMGPVEARSIFDEIYPRVVNSFDDIEHQ